MRDPEGYREAADMIETATPEQKKRMAQEQASYDREKAIFDFVLGSATPSPSQIHDLLLSNLTTRAHFHQQSLGLVWMQCQPWKWWPYHPEACRDVAEMINSEMDN
jgi:hypothetical protein